MQDAVYRASWSLPLHPRRATGSGCDRRSHLCFSALSIPRARCGEILSEHPEGQRLLVVFGTYAGRLSFFPLSTGFDRKEQK